MPIIKGEEVKRLLGKKEVKIDLNKHHISNLLEYASCPLHGDSYVILNKCFACRKKKTSKMKRFQYIGVGYTEY